MSTKGMELGTRYYLDPKWKQRQLCQIFCSIPQYICIFLASLQVLFGIVPLGETMFWLLHIMSCVAVGIAAHRKGYSEILWCLGGSTLAAVILILLPNTQQQNYVQEERIRRQIIGNAIDAILIAIVLLSILIAIRV